MADYYPLIARAIAGLEKNTGEARRALYERARTALVAQLRGVSPALEESEITRERLALEEAIRKVEAEAARRARSEGSQPFGAGAAAPAAAPSQPAPPPPQRPAPGERSEGKRADPRIDALRADLGRSGLPQRQGSGGAAAAAAVQKPPPPRPAMPPHEDVLKFRDKQGNAAPAPAPTPPPMRKPPRDPFADIPAGHDFDQLESRMQQPVEPESLRPKRRDTSLVESMEEPAEPSPLSRPRPRSYEEVEDEERPALRRAPRSYGGIIKAAVALILIAGIAGFLYWQRDAITGLYQALRGQASQVAREQPRDTKTPDGRPKFNDRIGPAADQAKQAQLPAVAQRVVLYEEEPSDPQGKRFVGSAVWRTETVPGAAGQPPELAVRADVEIPERRLTMRFSIRRNADQTLPASHTIEIMFNLPADFPPGGISNVPGILMKQAEQTRGTPLAGLAVKVTNNFFLIGLSAVESDLQRNIQLLKERSWFDIPVVYNNNRRAILAIEKGTPGEKAFAEAFNAWKQ